MMYSLKARLMIVKKKKFHRPKLSIIRHNYFDVFNTPWGSGVGADGAPW